MRHPLQKPRDELYRALGQLVVEWSRLESDVSTLVVALFAYHGKNLYDGLEQPSLGVALTANLDLRANIGIAKALSFPITDPPEFFARLEPRLNAIGVELRNQRNRLVHDRWSVLGADRIVRFQQGTRITREPGSGTARVRSIHRTVYASVREVENTAVAVERERVALEMLRQELGAARLRKYPREE